MKTTQYNEKIYSSFTKTHIKIIDGLIGKYVTNPTNITRVIYWLENNNMFLDKVKRKGSVE